MATPFESLQLPLPTVGEQSSVSSVSQNPSETDMWAEWTQEKHGLDMEQRLERFLPEWFKYQFDQKKEGMWVSFARDGALGTEYRILKNQYGEAYDAREKEWIAKPEQLTLRLQMLEQDLDIISTNRATILATYDKQAAELAAIDPTSDTHSGRHDRRRSSAASAVAPSLTEFRRSAEGEPTLRRRRRSSASSRRPSMSGTARPADDLTQSVELEGLTAFLPVYRRELDVDRVRRAELESSLREGRLALEGLDNKAAEHLKTLADLLNGFLAQADQEPPSEQMWKMIEIGVDALEREGRRLLKIVDLGSELQQVTKLKVGAAEFKGYYDAVFNQDEPVRLDALESEHRDIQRAMKQVVVKTEGRRRQIHAEFQMRQNLLMQVEALVNVIRTVTEQQDPSPERDAFQDRVRKAHENWRAWPRLERRYVIVDLAASQLNMETHASVLAVQSNELESQLNANQRRQSEIAALADPTMETEREQLVDSFSETLDAYKKTLHHRHVWLLDQHQQVGRMEKDIRSNCALIQSQMQRNDWGADLERTQGELLTKLGNAMSGTSQWHALRLLKRERKQSQAFLADVIVGQPPETLFSDEQRQAIATGATEYLQKANTTLAPLRADLEMALSELDTERERLLAKMDEHERQEWREQQMDSVQKMEQIRLERDPPEGARLSPEELQLRGIEHAFAWARQEEKRASRNGELALSVAEFRQMQSALVAKQAEVIASAAPDDLRVVNAFMRDGVRVERTQGLVEKTCLRQLARTARTEAEARLQRAIEEGALGPAEGARDLFAGKELLAQHVFRCQQRDIDYRLQLSKDLLAQTPNDDGLKQTIAIWEKMEGIITRRRRKEMRANFMNIAGVLGAASHIEGEPHWDVTSDFERGFNAFNSLDRLTNISPDQLNRQQTWLLGFAKYIATHEDVRVLEQSGEHLQVADHAGNDSSEAEEDVPQPLDRFTLEQNVVDAMIRAESSVDALNDLTHLVKQEDPAMLELLSKWEKVQNTTREMMSEIGGDSLDMGQITQLIASMDQLGNEWESVFPVLKIRDGLIGAVESLRRFELRLQQVRQWGAENVDDIQAIENWRKQAASEIARYQGFDIHSLPPGDLSYLREELEKFQGMEEQAESVTRTIEAPFEPRPMLSGKLEGVKAYLTALAAEIQSLRDAGMTNADELKAFDNRGFEVYAQMEGLLERVGRSEMQSGLDTAVDRFHERYETWKSPTEDRLKTLRSQLAVKKEMDLAAVYLERLSERISCLTTAGLVEHQDLPVLTSEQDIRLTVLNNISPRNKALPWSQERFQAGKDDMQQYKNWEADAEVRVQTLESLALRHSRTQLTTLINRLDLLRQTGMEINDRRQSETEALKQFAAAVGDLSDRTNAATRTSSRREEVTTTLKTYQERRTDWDDTVAEMEREHLNAQADRLQQERVVVDRQLEQLESIEGASQAIPEMQGLREMIEGWQSEIDGLLQKKAAVRPPLDADSMDLLADIDDTLNECESAKHDHEQELEYVRLRLIQEPLRKEVEDIRAELTRISNDISEPDAGESFAQLQRDVANQLVDMKRLQRVVNDLPRQAIKRWDAQPQQGAESDPKVWLNGQLSAFQAQVAANKRLLEIRNAELESVSNSRSTASGVLPEGAGNEEALVERIATTPQPLPQSAGSTPKMATPVLTGSEPPLREQSQLGGEVTNEREIEAIVVPEQPQRKVVLEPEQPSSSQSGQPAEMVIQSTESKLHRVRIQPAEEIEVLESKPQKAVESLGGEEPLAPSKSRLQPLVSPLSQTDITPHQPIPSEITRAPLGDTEAVEKTPQRLVQTSVSQQPVIGASTAAPSSRRRSMLERMRWSSRSASASSSATVSSALQPPAPPSTGTDGSKRRSFTDFLSRRRRADSSAATLSTPAQAVPTQMSATASQPPPTTDRPRHRYALSLTGIFRRRHANTGPSSGPVTAPAFVAPPDLSSNITEQSTRVGTTDLDISALTESPAGASRRPQEVQDISAVEDLRPGTFVFANPAELLGGNATAVARILRQHGELVSEGNVCTIITDIDKKPIPNPDGKFTLLNMQPQDIVLSDSKSKSKVLELDDVEQVTVSLVGGNIRATPFSRRRLSQESGNSNQGSPSKTEEAGKKRMHGR